MLLVLSEALLCDQSDQSNSCYHYYRELDPLAAQLTLSAADNINVLAEAVLELWMSSHMQPTGRALLAHSRTWGIKGMACWNRSVSCIMLI